MKLWTKEKTKLVNEKKLWCIETVENSKLNDFGLCGMILPPLPISLFNAFRKRYGCLMPTHCSMIWFDVSNLLLGLNN